jgi:uncharacterized membrane protein YdjX (TVP38/TMEM64 family)
MTRWRRWKYHNLGIALLGLIITILVLRIEVIHNILLSLGDLGYFGALIAGALFVSTFTAPTGAVVLLILAERLDLLELVFIAGFGGVLGDLIVFKFFKNNLAKEIGYLYHELGGHHLKKVWQSPYFNWTLPVIGALIIASPLPDELGVSLLGLSKMKTWQFIAISFAMNMLGVILVVFASRWIKP